MPILLRIALTKRSITAASQRRAADAPHTGLGHNGSSLRRATTWMCSCGTMLPIAATFSLSHRVSCFSARETSDSSIINMDCSEPRSMISLAPTRRGTMMSHGKSASFMARRRDRAQDRRSGPCRRGAVGEGTSRSRTLPPRASNASELSRRRAVWLAFSSHPADIETGRLAVDEPLANRVRSGRKQP